MRILVVDDDPEILHLCARALESMGHQVVTCTLGGEGLQAAMRGNFDLALCDLNLPDVHGLEVIRAIKMQAPDLAVIVMSALDPREWGEKSADAGAVQYLQKPLRLDALRAEVSLAAASRTNLRVAIQDTDTAHAERLRDTLARAGCEVRVVTEPLAMISGDWPELAILEGAAPGAEAVVRWAGARSVPCFVLIERDKPFDDRLLRLGASLVIHKPVDPTALLMQARFLASR